MANAPLRPPWFGNRGVQVLAVGALAYNLVQLVLHLVDAEWGAAFAALLGRPEDHGRWLLTPAGGIQHVERRYRDHTLVLETEFLTATGRVRLVDCMPPRQSNPDLVRVVEGLEVDAAAMRRNIDLTGGLVMSEAVMMGLGPYIGREYAHDLVYDICRDAVTTGRPLLDLLAEHPEISKHLDRDALAKLCDPANYLGQAGVMVDRVLDRLAERP